MKLNPAPGQLTVRRLRQDEVSKGGIIIAERAREELPYGEVLALGACRERDQLVREDLDLKVGSVVVFHEFAATKVDLDGDGQYYFLQYEDILGTLAEDSECK